MTGRDSCLYKSNRLGSESLIIQHSLSYNSLEIYTVRILTLPSNDFPKIAKIKVGSDQNKNYEQ